MPIIAGRQQADVESSSDGSEDDVVPELGAERSSLVFCNARLLFIRSLAGIAILSLATFAVSATAPTRLLSENCGECPAGGQMVYNSAAGTCVCPWCAESSWSNVHVMCRRKCFYGDAPQCAQCFPDDAVVSVELPGGLVAARAMSQLRVGDSVLTEAGFSKVFAFMDHAVGAEVEYVQVETASGHALAATASHMVYAHEDRRAVLAGSLVEGDWLWASLATNGSDGFAQSRVASVKRTWRRGMHAPLTEQGSIVVDGLLASSYANIKTLRWGDRSIVSGHDLGRYLHEPLRLACSAAPALCSPSWHSLEGRHLWTQFLLDNFSWLQAMNDIHSDIHDALFVRPSAYSWLSAFCQVAVAALLSMGVGFGSHLAVLSVTLAAKELVRPKLTK